MLGHPITQLVLSRPLRLLYDLPPTNQPVQICLVPAILPHRDRLPANHLRLLSRNVLRLQTCPVPTTLQRSNILSSHLKFNPTPADLQICLALALLLYIRLPANRPQHQLEIRVCLQWIVTQIVTWPLKYCLGYTSVSVRCRRLILGRNLELTFDLALVTLTLKILPGL